MKRIYRNLKDETKEKIAQSMKRYHQEKTTEQARTTASKLSSSMKKYWSGVPNKNEYQQEQHRTMEDFLRGGLDAENQ